MLFQSNYHPTKDTYNESCTIVADVRRNHIREKHVDESLGEGILKTETINEHRRLHVYLYFSGGNSSREDTIFAVCWFCTMSAISAFNPIVNESRTRFFSRYSI